MTRDHGPTKATRSRASFPSPATAGPPTRRIDAVGYYCVNQQGNPIKALGYALRSALGAAGIPYQNLANGTFGSLFAADLRVFRDAVLGVPVVARGLLLDPATVDALTEYMAPKYLELMDDPVSGTRYDDVLFNAGDEGPPVGAAQNALHSLLGGGANNRSAAYGANTAADMRTLAALQHFPDCCEGRAVTYIGWQVMLSVMSEANRANAGKPLKVDVPSGQTILSLGWSGEPVEGMQAALASILGDESQNARNGQYGSMTAADLVAARQRFNLTPVGDGSGCPKVLWDVLYSYCNAENQAKMREPGTPPSSSVPGDIGDRVASSARAAWSELRDVWTYRQYRAMADSLWSSFAEDHTDCSSYATLCAKDAGAPDPNERGYDGYGYTGTLWPCSSPCDPRPGALAFYGGSSGNDSTHVAVVDEDASGVYSFGSTPLTHYSTIAYRGDYRGCRWPHAW
jgi:hypothetical protein